MNILVDIGHPAHVHLFKNVARELDKRGHKLYYSVRDIPVAKRLMDSYGMPYLDLGPKSDSLLGKAVTIVKQDLKLLRFVKKNHIDMGLSSGIVLSHVSMFSGMSSVMFDDDDDAAEPLVVKYGHPYTDVVLTPSAIHRKTNNALYYNGTHELAYLHPNRFVPDESVLDRAGLKKGERFFIMRFVSMKGHHDIGQSGLSHEQKLDLIVRLRPFGRVIITSENSLEAVFEPYRLPVPPEDILSLMYYAALFVGDSQTMTSEACLLGVPAFKCNTFSGRLSVPNLYESYGLSKSYSPDHFATMCKDIIDVLSNPDTARSAKEKRDQFLANHIDVTAFYTWFLDGYPDTVEELGNVSFNWDRFR